MASPLSDHHSLPPVYLCYKCRLTKPVTPEETKASNYPTRNITTPTATNLPHAHTIWQTRSLFYLTYIIFLLFFHLIQKTEQKYTYPPATITTSSAAAAASNHLLLLFLCKFFLVIYYCTIVVALWLYTFSQVVLLREAAQAQARKRREARDSVGFDVDVYSSLGCKGPSEVAGGYAVWGHVLLETVGAVMYVAGYCGLVVGFTPVRRT